VLLVVGPDPGFNADVDLGAGLGGGAVGTALATLIVVAIPLLIVAIVVWIVGAVIASLAIADRLIGHEDGWLKPLLVAGAINGGLALTGVRGIVSFAVGAAGLGTVLRAYLE